MNERPGKSGFFGKVPALGDFVQRALPTSFVQPWDAWLGRVVAGSKATLGEQWLDIYLQSPIWRFVLSAGVVDAHTWAGVMMPSVDRVGRYFPLTIAGPLSADVAMVATVRGSAWFDQAQALALAALDEDTFDLASFEADVAALGVAQPGALCQRVSENNGQGGWCYSLSNFAGVGDGLDHLAAGALGNALGSYSMWWTEGSNLLPSSLVVHAGLPPAGHYSSMLDGRWARTDVAEFAPASTDEALA